MKQEMKKTSDESSKKNSVRVVTPTKETNIPVQKRLKRGVLLAIFLGLVLSGLYVYWEVYMKGVQKTEVNEENDVVVETSSPEEEMSLKRGDLSVKILNGSGVSGVAGGLEDYLAKLGYVDIEVGNADSFGYEDLTVSLLKIKSEYLDLIDRDLSDGFRINGEIELIENQDVDLLIILGS